jgi:hypothetical protein
MTSPSSAPGGHRTTGTSFRGRAADADSGYGFEHLEEVDWRAGDRDYPCSAYAPDLAKFTDSVRDTGG